jgi:4-carboxymuconolactone decarboxylase
MPEQLQATQNPPTFGRYAEIPPEQFSPQQKEAYDYIVEERGMCPGPYRIWLQNPELLKALTPIGVYYQKKLQISRQEHEIVTNCINGKWATAGYSNKEHEEIAEKAGLPAEKVQALIAGLPTNFDDPQQQVIYEITQTLIASRHVPQGLYQRAVDLLGDAGLTDVTVLIGYFTSVSMTLAVYDVPAGAPDDEIGFPAPHLSVCPPSVTRRKAKLKISRRFFVQRASSAVCGSLLALRIRKSRLRP